MCVCGGGGVRFWEFGNVYAYGGGVRLGYRGFIFGNV